MNLIDKQLAKIKQENRLGLMTHLVVGYPSLEVTESLVRVMDNAGVDFIELQIPFSDPLADGPTIMRACEKALENGVKVKDAFELAKRLTEQGKIPILFMAYYNTVFRYGTEKFCQDAKKVGISGLIIPDLNLDEEHQEHFIKFCKQTGLKNIRVVSPASTLERLRKNARVANGFIYCTAKQGITGKAEELNPNISSYLKTVKKIFKIPIACGFGISKKSHLRKLSSYAEIVVIGSTIIDVINRSNNQTVEKNINKFLINIKI